MKISGVGSVGVTGSGKLARKSEAAPGFSDLLKSGTASAVSPVAPTVTPTGIQALLAAQEAPDSTKRRSAGLKRGRVLLDGLDELRHALLAGSISPAKVQSLLDAVRAEKLEVDEPGLQQVLSDIELRAQVEMAKLGRFA